MAEDIFDIIEPMCMQIEPVGSRITCNPPPTDTDQDFLLLVKRNEVSNVIKALQVKNWKIGGSQCSLDSDFVSLKFEDLNFIITTNREYFNKFMAATSVAKKFNLMNKSDRIILFEAVLHARSCSYECEEENKEIDYLAITRSFF